MSFPLSPASTEGIRNEARPRGEGMSYNKKRSSTDDAYRASRTTRPHVRERGADELRGLLQRIADHIAAADRRQQSALGDVQSRKDRLSENWPGQGAQTEAAGRTFWSDPLQEELRRRASTAAHSQMFADRVTGSRAHTRHQHPRYEDQHEGWDPASAEALTRLYEPEHTADPHTIFSDLTSFDAPKSGQENWAQGELGSATYPSSNQRPEGVDRLESRIADLALRIEQALAQLRSGSAAEALDARLASLDSKLGTALQGLPTRADVEQLQALEGHIRELAQYVERAHHRLTRLDDIEMHLARLVEQTSDEHLIQLLDQQIHSESHVSRLAEAVAEHLSDRDSFRDELGSGANRLRELHELIEQFVSTQRQEQQTASALEGIQQSVLKLLDRMEALERTYNSVRTVDHSEAGEVGAEHRDDGTKSRPRYPLKPVDPYAPSVVTISRVTKDSPPMSAGSKAEDTGAEASGLPAMGELSGEGSEAFSAASQAPGSTEHAPLPRTREAFLNAARRAAQKASSKPVGGESLAPRKRAALGGRRPSGTGPLSGFLVAALALVLAVGVGVTTYSAYKDEFGNAWKLGQRVLELGSSGRGSAAGGRSGSASPTRDGMGAGGQSPDAPGHTPRLDSGEVAEEARAVTSSPGGIVIAPTEITASAHGGEVPVTAALTAPDANAVSGQPFNRTAADNKPMPPAGVGPLSLRIAAANGDPSAEFEVAVRFDEGRGVPRDHVEAAKWYKRSAAKGFAPAQYRLGTLYERGLGLAADRGRAMAWYKSAAEKGHLKAMHNFAVLKASENSPDFEMAAHWFGKAANSGLVDSQYNLAILYEIGRGVERDLKEAYKWFALAARAGDREAARRRDRVRWMLTAAELEAAETMIRSWEPEPVDRAINDPRIAGEAWKRNEDRG